MTTDFTVWYDGGTIALLSAVSEAGADWADTHLPQDAASLGCAVAIEPRYLDDIIDGIQTDGLIVVTA